MSWISGFWSVLFLSTIPGLGIIIWFVPEDEFSIVDLLAVSTLIGPGALACLTYTARVAGISIYPSVVVIITLSIISILCNTDEFLIIIKNYEMRNSLYIILSLFLVLLSFYILIAYQYPRSVVSYHGIWHTSSVYSTMEHPISPMNPAMDGVLLSTYWLFHYFAGIATLDYIHPLQIFFSINVISLLGVLIIIHWVWKNNHEKKSYDSIIGGLLIAVVGPGLWFPLVWLAWGILTGDWTHKFGVESVYNFTPYKADTRTVSVWHKYLNVSGASIGLSNAALLFGGSLRILKTDDKSFYFLLSFLAGLGLFSLHTTIAFISMSSLSVGAIIYTYLVPWNESKSILIYIISSLVGCLLPFAITYKSIFLLDTNLKLTFFNYINGYSMVLSSGFLIVWIIFLLYKSFSKRDSSKMWTLCSAFGLLLFSSTVSMVDANEYKSILLLSIITGISIACFYDDYFAKSNSMIAFALLLLVVVITSTFSMYKNQFGTYEISYPGSFSSTHVFRDGQIMLKDNLSLNRLYHNIAMKYDEGNTVLVEFDKNINTMDGTAITGIPQFYAFSTVYQSGLSRVSNEREKLLSNLKNFESVANHSFHSEKNYVLVFDNSKYHHKKLESTLTEMGLSVKNIITRGHYKALIFVNQRH